VLDTDQRESAEFADVVLPIATYAESDGTFTNHARRVQRFRAAVAPPGDARPGWRAVAQLLAAVTGQPAFETVEAVFGVLAAESAAFAGLSWDALGGQGLPARDDAPGQPPSR
jgi:predicted molibdopterin-dependent oxidoreductase YjgC